MAEESSDPAERIVLHEEPRRVRARYDWSSTRPSTAVLKTVAIAADCEEVDLEPLYGRLDPDALDALVQSSPPAPNGETTVSFRFADHWIAVHSTGEVTVRKTRREDRS